MSFLEISPDTCIKFSKIWILPLRFLCFSINIICFLIDFIMKPYALGMVSHNKNTSPVFDISSGYVRLKVKPQPIVNWLPELHPGPPFLLGFKIRV
jgi:hypothetical protein